MQPDLPTTLLIGSCEAFGGKSAVVLGLLRQLLAADRGVRVGKPLATSVETAGSAGQDALIDDDVRFIGAILGLPPEHLLPSLHQLDADSATQRLLQGDAGPADHSACQAVRQQLQDLGPDALVLLVHTWSDARSVEPLLEARAQLGDLLAGVVLNAVAPEDVEAIRAQVCPALARLGIPVYGVLPRSPLLRSVTVEELVARLDARVLCCQDRLDLLVETLSIGAMNVNAAMEFFRRRRNMAVVTGADRTDIQLAALEASTQCLILTGVGEPLPQLINRAEELEVPLLKVEHDTLTTVEVIEHAFGHVRLHEGVKATYAMRLVDEHCDFGPLFTRLGLPLPV